MGESNEAGGVLMQKRILHLWSTVPALFVLGALAYFISRKPDLLDRPESLLTLAAGLLGLFYKGRAGGDESNG
jgi:ABC-type microcin C transport system permease subunit YejE